METLRVKGQLGSSTFGDIDLDDPIASSADKLDQDVSQAILDGRFNSLISETVGVNADALYIETVLRSSIEVMQRLQNVTGTPADETISTIDQVQVELRPDDPRFYRFYVAVTSVAGAEAPILTGLLPTVESLS
jgi:hypothetical protein